MRLSTKGRYAVTAMLDLALHGEKNPVTLADISNNQGISLSYLEQLFASMRSKGLVKGVRGPGGGYYLGKPASEISVANIICAVDEWVEFTRCKGKEDFGRRLGAAAQLAGEVGQHLLLRRGVAGSSLFSLRVCSSRLPSPLNEAYVSEAEMSSRMARR